MSTGTTSLSTSAVDRGSMGRPGGSTSSPTIDLATLEVAGAASAALAAIPAQAAPRELRSTSPDRTRVLTLAMGGMGAMGGSGARSFTIDGRSFDPTRIDQHVTAGSIEEWTIVNTSQMDHPFHLHVWPMQVLRVGSETIGPAVWHDVVNVPAQNSTTVRIAFDDITGTTVFHCHILDHEDLGMMGLIRVA
jgi:FtsP/CotA-like multicopper oxidase with cupredoxin domain